MDDFMIDEVSDKEIDIRYNLKEVEECREGYRSECEWNENGKDGEEGRIAPQLIYQSRRKDMLCICKNPGREYSLRIKNNLISEGIAFKNSNILSLMRLEDVLLERGSFFLHASLISWKGKGILFSAPSGTGKSTQAQLWEIHEGAEIINGDRAIIRKKEDGYWAYGSPYAGTSGIFKNKKAKIAAIFILKQSPINKVSELKAKDIFKKIFSETSVHASNTHYMEIITKLLLDAVWTIPIYQLECTPTIDAIETVKNILIKCDPS